MACLLNFTSLLLNTEILANPRYVRVNSLMVTLADAHSHLETIGYSFQSSPINFGKKPILSYFEDPHIPHLLVFHPSTKLHDNDWVNDGKFVLQDKSSCFVAPILGPHPGSVVLDMCAAPGLKTQHIACQLQGIGEIIAVDNSKPRFKVLTDFVDKFGLKNVKCLNEDALKLSDDVRQTVQYILLDAPCSGSGVVKTFDFKSSPSSKSFHNLQASLLRSALTEYPMVRRVVYSTCSSDVEENEAVVEEFLEPPDGFILTNLASFYPNFSTGNTDFQCGKFCIRLEPEKNQTNGFFIAMFERPNPPGLE